VVTHLYHLAQQKLRYKIVKNRSKIQKNGFILTSKLQFFFSGTSWPPAAGGFATDPSFCLFKTFSS